MAITAPGNFTCGKSEVYPGEKVTFTWTAATGDFDYYKIAVGYSDIGLAYYPDKSATSYEITILDDPEAPIGHDTYFLLMAVKGNDYDNPEETSEMQVLTLPLVAAPDTPPIPSTGSWRLEQFQNSAGKDVYPRTILEGIFRKSDGKSLLDVLEEIEKTPGPAGKDGKDGTAAGFGTPTASVDANVGTPSVTVTASGPDTAKVFDFIFKNLKGATGATGATGPGVPTGGTAGQVLTKNSSTNYDTKWANPPSGNYLPLSGGTLTGNLTIKGSGNFGTQINLGDGDYVHISEPTDDNMEIKAKTVNFVTSGTPPLQLNGSALISGGTSDLTAGSSSLATGTIYLVYE